MIFQKLCVSSRAYSTLIIHGDFRSGHWNVGIALWQAGWIPMNVVKPGEIRIIPLEPAPVDKNAAWGSLVKFPNQRTQKKINLSLVLITVLSSSIVLVSHPISFLLHCWNTGLKPLFIIKSIFDPGYLCACLYGIIVTTPTPLLSFSESRHSGMSKCLWKNKHFIAATHGQTRLHATPRVSEDCLGHFQLCDLAKHAWSYCCKVAAYWSVLLQS